MISSVFLLASDSPHDVILLQVSKFLCVISYRFYIKFIFSGKKYEIAVPGSGIFCSKARNKTADHPVSRILHVIAMFN